MAQERTHARLGERLVASGLLSREHLEIALAEQARTGLRLGRILRKHGFVEEEAIARIEAEDLDLPFAHAEELQVEPSVLSTFDRDFVIETGAFPLRFEGEDLFVATTRPGDPESLARLRERYSVPLSLIVTTWGDIETLLKEHLASSSGRVEEILANVDRDSTLESLPIEEAVDALLGDAVRQGATDIHIEPEEDLTRVRLRVDGCLFPAVNLPKAMSDGVLSRLKVLSRLDIAERRRPQDGRMRIVVDGQDVDLRVSIMPAGAGENAVLRVLGRTSGVLRLGQLGISGDVQAALRRVVDRSHGLFLVTGPTGSGKSTTLYALLAEIDAITRKVATIEDPIEYRLPFIRQSQVDRAIGFDFQSGLRALLRQDPDVILVGEIRDSETADLAIKASMTGHLVLTTLHTNSSIGALPRLVDLGIEPYLVEDSLIGVLAQRLVRKVCVRCARKMPATEAESAWLREPPDHLLRGEGCERCKGTGYSGRLALSELFLPDDSMTELLRSGASPDRLLEAARAVGFRSLEEDGRRKVLQGLTTMEEVERVYRSHRLSQEERRAAA